jgi:hypothetical protein
MAVTGRSPSIVSTETGNSYGILAENFTKHQNAFSLIDVNSGQKFFLRVYRDEIEGFKRGLIGWGAGTRVLFLENLGELTPVVALFPQNNPALQTPAECTIIESPVDPVVKYFPTQKLYVIYYWVNAWSPPSPLGATQQKTLFQSAKPPNPVFFDPGYLADSYSGLQPPSRFTSIRDVPSWYLPGTHPISPVDFDELQVTIPYSTTNSERVGPFDLNRFWVAPFTDAHLFRFPSDYDPFPPPPQQAPAIPPLPPGPPPPPPPQAVVTDPPSNLLDSFPDFRIPQTDTTKELNQILFNIKNRIILNSGQRSTLDTYVFALQRIGGLARCSRVLMRAQGTLFSGASQNDPDYMNTYITPSQSLPDKAVRTYLVVDHPQPVLAISRGINKTLIGRPKMTSFLRDSSFITAALTYRYPAAGTVSLCAGDPQVDFTVHCPSDKFDELRRMGILPDSLTPQHAPFISGSSIIIPGNYGVSLVEVLSNMEIW